MKWDIWVFFAAFIVALVLGMPVRAEAQTGAGTDADFPIDIVQEPICFQVLNETDHSVLGSFITDYYMHPDGVKAKHRSNFRLEALGETHEEGYPLDRAEFCTYGPFYPGRKLELTLRTIVPVFSCQTRIEDGLITIRDEVKEDGTRKMVADCYE